MTEARTTLKPGDVLFWAADPEDEHREGTPVLVEEDGLRVVYSPYLWHETTFLYDTGEQGHGMTVEDAELALRLGVYPVGFPGHIYKSYDEASGRSFTDPDLEVE